MKIIDEIKTIDDLIRNFKSLSSHYFDFSNKSTSNAAMYFTMYFTYKSVYEAIEELKENMENDDGWLKIESAPKDGDDIILGYFDGISHPSCEVAHWLEYRKLWSTTHTLLNSEGPFSPTHWRPCPEPPKLKI